ncbi:MAG: hypothetical protein FJZ01_04795 [Candidatus Sericytochromatia bacterium]|nr:hypothetical protein [Candidatus Tanganyikabacteria bacterium]
MRILLRLLLLAAAAALLAGCPRPASQALAGLARVPGGLSLPGPGAPDYTIRGRVENAQFRVQAAFGDIAPNATVALIDGTSGETLQTARTDASGGFTMAFPRDFVPDNTKFYTLEAVKGGKINGGYNFAGAPAIRLRTVLQWSQQGEFWMSLTGKNTGDPAVINRSTTAVAVAVGLRQAAVTDPTNRAVFYRGIIGQIDLNAADGTYPHKYAQDAVNSTITVGEFRTLFDLVDRALLNGQDPVGSIAWANQPTDNPRQYVLMPQGFLLSGFDVTSGRASASVKANGAGFPLDANRIKVVFGGGAEARTLAVNQTGTQVTFEVPVGALSGPVTLKVTLPGSTAELLLIGPSFTVLTTDGHSVLDAGGNFWVAGRGNDTLWSLSPGGGWKKRSPVAVAWKGPRGLTVDPQNQVVFTSWESGTVNRLIPGTGDIGSVSQLSSGLANPWGIAREPNGNFVVANHGGNDIRRVAQGGGTAAHVATVSAPAGLAIGPQGDMFVTSHTTGTLIMFASTSPTVAVPVLTGLAKPAGVAVQSDGTVAIACYGSDQIVRWHPSRGLQAPIVPRGTHLGIIDVAADDQGRLFFGAFDSHTLGRVESTGAITDLALAPRNVWGLSASKAGDLAIGIINDLWPYGYRPRDSRVYIAPFSTGSYQPFVHIDGFSNPEAVAYDASGDLYVADAGADRLFKISNPPSGARTPLIDGIGRVGQLAVDAAGKVYLASLGGPLSIWDPATPASLKRFAPGRAFWAVTRADLSGATYLASPGDGQIVEIASDGTQRNLAALPGVTGLAVSGASLFAVTRDSGAIYSVNSTTGATTQIAEVGAGAADMAIVGTDIYVSLLSGPIKKVASLGTGAISTVLTIPGDHAVRMFARASSPPEIFYTLRKTAKVEKLANLAGAVASVSVATLPAFAGPDLRSDPATESLSGLAGLAYYLSDLYVAQSVGGAARIYKLTEPIAADQTAAVPWATLNAPIMGLTSYNQGGTGMLLAANPQEGTVAGQAGLDASVGFSVNTNSRAVASLGVALGRVMGVALVPSSPNFYLLTSPTLNSTAIASVAGGATWRRTSGTAPCCGANHPFVDSSGNLYIPSYTGLMGIRTLGTGGTPGGADLAGTTYGAMSGVAADAKGSGLVAGSLGGGIANAPLVRFSPGQAAIPLDNWPYEPGF